MNFERNVDQSEAGVNLKRKGGVTCIPLGFNCNTIGHTSAMPLSMHNISNIFVQLQRQKRRGGGDDNDTAHKDHHIRSSSGDSPNTHSTVASQDQTIHGPRLSRDDFFICTDAVDVPRLLRASRNALYNKAIAWGGNALVNEEWECTICGPKHRRSGNFHVKVHYCAVLAQSDSKDPGVPPNLQRSRGVPGLMTIISRRGSD